MHEIRTQIEIEATAEQVWEVLTDFAAYPEWNSVMWPDGGEVRSGARLRVRVRMPGGLRVKFQPIVRRAERGRELCWHGRLPARLLEGVHYFTIEPLGENRVRFVQREVYAGILAPIYIRVMEGWVRRAYQEMNRELKLRSERVWA